MTERYSTTRFREPEDEGGRDSSRAARRSAKIRDAHAEALSEGTYVGSTLYKALLAEAAPMYLADRRGELIYASPAFRELARHAFADDPEEAQLARTPGALRGLFDGIAEKLEDATTREVIAVGTSLRHYSARHFPVTNPDGDLIAFGGVYTDIGPQIRAERQAGHLRARYEDVIRSVSDWVWETDVNLNLTHASLRIAETLGTPPQLLRGRYLLSLGAFEDDPKTTRTAEKIIEARAPFRNHTFVIKDRRGRKRRIHLSGVPVFDDSTGRFIGYRGTGTDVTRAQEAEQRAGEAQRNLQKALEDLKTRNIELDEALREAKAAAKAKADFLAMMSHELRTPLNAIIGFSEMSLRQIFGPLNEHYRGYFRDILGAGQHLLGIISDILDATDIEKRGLRVGTQRVKAKEVLAEAKSLIGLRAEEKDIDTRAVAIHEDWTLAVDPVRMRQILVNLLNNAVKFTPEGGRIGVEAREIVTGHLDVTVWDTGIGIPAEQQALIFESFYQGSDAFQRGPEGIGLGLSVSRYLARLMGGDIFVKSEPGQGSRFTVRVGLADKAADEEAKEADIDLRGLLKRKFRRKP